MAPAGLDLTHQGVVLVHPTLLPALVPDTWQEAGAVGGVRLVAGGGGESDTRAFLLAPSEAPAESALALAQAGVAAVVYVGACVSPSRALQPGDALVVERARTPTGEIVATAALANKLANRCARRGVIHHRGAVSSGGRRGDGGDLGEEADVAFALEAALDAGIPAGAILVCEGADTSGPEAPASVLEGFDKVFGVLQEILGSARNPP